MSLNIWEKCAETLARGPSIRQRQHLNKLIDLHRLLSSHEVALQFEEVGLLREMLHYCKLRKSILEVLKDQPSSTEIELIINYLGVDPVLYQMGQKYTQDENK
jgi:hypothetical protein